MKKDGLDVCLIAPFPPPYGGIGNWTKKILNYASGITVVHLRLIDISPRWRAIDDLVIWKRVVGGGLQLIRDYLRFLKQLWRPPQVIHLNTSGQLTLVRDWAIAWTAHIIGIPVVYHIRFGRIPELAGGNSLEWRMMHRVLRMVHTVIAIDAATEQTLQMYLDPSRIHRIPNFIDVSTLPQSAPDCGETKTVLFIGWVIPTKGIEELIKAWVSLNPHGWQLLIVGPGNPNYQDSLTRTCNPANLHFLGERQHAEAMQLIAQSDIFILPSYTEGFPNVIVEAMALNRAIIGTRVGAIPEMLGEDRGILIEPKNVEGIKSALTDLMKDEGLRIRLGNNARQFALKNYTIDVVFGKYKEVWRKAAGLE